MCAFFVCLVIIDYPLEVSVILEFIKMLLKCKSGEMIIIFINYEYWNPNVLTCVLFVVMILVVEENVLLKYKEDIEVGSRAELDIKDRPNVRDKLK